MSLKLLGVLWRGYRSALRGHLGDLMKRGLPSTWFYMKSTTVNAAVTKRGAIEAIDFDDAAFFWRNNTAASQQTRGMDQRGFFRSGSAAWSSLMNWV